MKRVFDVFFSLMGLFFLLPAILIICILVLLDDGTPVIYKQQRIGKHGQPFTLFKFRSMRNDLKGLKITAGNDPRITKTGNWLRKLKLDELPQLINILIGDMSFVGPRPEVEKYVKLYTVKQREVLTVKPGLTGLDSLNFSNESELLEGQSDPEAYYIQNIMPQKLDLSLDYIKRRSMKLDVSIILQTIRKVFG